MGARGDQCDGCGTLIDAATLIDPKCSICSKTPHKKSSRHLFLNLAKLQGQVQKWKDDRSSHWSKVFFILLLMLFCVSNEFLFFRMRSKLLKDGSTGDWSAAALPAT